MKKIIIFGAGLIGRYAFEFFGNENVEYFADNDPKKWGNEYIGKKILKPEELVYVKDRFDIVIANLKYSKEIQRQLQALGIQNSIIFTTEYADIKKGLRNVTEDILLVIDDEDDDFHKYLKFHLGFIKVSARYMTLAEFQISDNSENEKHIYIYSKNHHAEINYILRDKNVTDLLLWVLWSDTDIVKIPDEAEWERVKEENEWLNNSIQGHVVDNVDNFVKIISCNKEIPLFKIIELETINRCNSKCQFCPVNATVPQRPKKYMSNELFHKIINELKTMNFVGQICMFSANEPFLDPNIIDRIKFAKINLPNAKMNITSNGSMLNLKKFLASIDYIDELIINNYDTERKVHDNLWDIVNYCKEHPEKSYQEKVQIRVRRVDEILSSRAGKAPNRKEFFDVSRHSCALPFQQIIVSPDGKVKLCSNDTLGDCILGDVNTESLVDIWYGEKFNNVREKLFKGRETFDICSKCDFFYIV